MILSAELRFFALREFNLQSQTNNSSAVNRRTNDAVKTADETTAENNPIPAAWRHNRFSLYACVRIP